MPTETKATCHCLRKATVHESGRLVCSGCDLFVEFCKGDHCKLGDEKNDKKK